MAENVPATQTPWDRRKYLQRRCPRRKRRPNKSPIIWVTKIFKGLQTPQNTTAAWNGQSKIAQHLKEDEAINDIVNFLILSERPNSFAVYAVLGGKDGLPQTSS